MRCVSAPEPFNSSRGRRQSRRIDKGAFLLFEEGADIMGFRGTKLGKDCERFLQAIPCCISALGMLKDEAEVVEAPRLAIAVRCFSVDPEGFLEVPHSLLKAPHVAARED